VVGTVDRSTIEAPVDSSVVAVPGVSFAYLPALDGIRAAAVLGVLLYHANQPWAQGGFLGVDAFFVLSGFLITSLLLTEFAQTGTVGLRSFYARRARRLLPAMILVVGVVVLFWHRLVPEASLGQLRADALGALGYVSNWRLLFSGQSYFESVGTPSPLRHFWSLGIEEQWYLVWPAVLLFCLHRWPRRRILAVAGAGALFSAVLMAVLYHPNADPARVYYGTDTRAQSLLIGAVLAGAIAAHGEIRSRVGRALLPCAALVAGAYILWRWSATKAGDVLLYRGGFFLHALAVAVVIAAVVQPRRGLLKAALSWSPLRWIGMISYGLYLWHWPIYLWLNTDRTGLSGNALLATRLLVTFAVATVSYYLVEWPIRHRRLPARVTVAVLAASTTVVLVCAVTVSTSAAPTTSRVAKLLAGPHPTVPLTTRPGPTGAATPPATPPAAPAPTPVLFLGDSVGWSMEFGFTPALQSANGVRVVERTHWGCALASGPYRALDGIVRAHDDTCPDWVASWPALVDNLRPALTVVSFGPWEVFPHEVDGQWVTPGTPEYDAYYRARLRATTKALVGDGGRVVYLTAPSFTRDESTPRPEPWDVDHADLIRHYNDLLRQEAAADPAHVSIIDVYGWVCPHDQCRESQDGVKLRFDEVHYGLEGGRLLAEWLLPQIAAEAHGTPVSPVQSP
jgi:peptidoglycan/LPS O-acetylase OafA/YrhL